MPCIYEKYSYLCDMDIKAMKNTAEIQYTIKLLHGLSKGKIINRVFSIEEIENDGIASWLTNHGYYHSVSGAISKYVEVLNRELL